MEEWKDIKGHELSYQISSFGRVKNLERIVFRGNGNHARRIKERILKACPDGKGYYTVRLFNKTHKVHVLVAKHFIKNPLNLPQVNHKDRDKSNNNKSNLEWCTASQNVQHSWIVGDRIRGFGEINPMAVLSNKQVIEIKILINKGMSNKSIAYKYGVSYKHIWAIRAGKRRINS